MEDKNIVDYVAKLARIKIVDDEKDHVKAQLGKILKYVDKLKELDVEGVAPMRGLHLDANVFRDDVAEDKTFKQDILNNAPAREDDYFKVPKVID